MTSDCWGPKVPEGFGTRYLGGKMLLVVHRLNVDGHQIAPSGSINGPATSHQPSATRHVKTASTPGRRTLGAHPGNVIAKASGPGG